MKLRNILVDLIPVSGFRTSWKRVREMNADYFVDVENCRGSFIRNSLKNFSYGVLMTGVQVAEFYGIYLIANNFFNK